jgi:hypothetical protein
VNFDIRTVRSAYFNAFRIDSRSEHPEMIPDRILAAMGMLFARQLDHGLGNCCGLMIYL